MHKYMNNNDKINAWFDKFEHKFDYRLPQIVEETAVEFTKENFVNKSFDGKPWPQTKRPNPKGSLMVRSGALLNSIRPVETSPRRVLIAAGNSKVPYARIHNEGGVIEQAARSETFVRNRYKKGPKSKYFGGMGAFRKGTTDGQGLTFKARTINMPQRKFMGHSAVLNKRIILRVKGLFNER